jgi:hypothetical protein
MGSIIRTISIILAAFTCLSCISCIASVSVNKQIQNKVNEATTELNHAMVYFNNDEFKEARQSLINAQLYLIDVDPLLENTKLNKVDKTNGKLAISAMGEILISVNKLVDFMETLKTHTDCLTWRPYNEMLGNITEGRDRLKKAENIASGITDIKFKSGLDKITEVGTQIDAALVILKQSNVEKFVKIYTYIYKIDPESVRDLTITTSKDGTSDKDKTTKIFNYVRDTIQYIKDPRYTELDFDYIQTPKQTVERKAGDCDDQAVLLASMLESVGYGVNLCFVDTENKNPPVFNHVNVKVNVDNYGYGLDTTCKTCKFGEYPSSQMTYECYDYAKMKETAQKMIQDMKKRK